MSRRLGGPRWARAVGGTLFVLCFGTAVAYIVAIGDILAPVLVAVGAPAWCTRELSMFLFVLAIMFPLSTFERCVCVCVCVRVCVDVSVGVFARVCARCACVVCATRW